MVKLPTLTTKTFYRDSTVTRSDGSGTVTVKVHTGGLFVNDALVNATVEVVMDSRRRLNEAITKLQNHQRDPDSEFLTGYYMQMFFNTSDPPTVSETGQIIAKLELLRGGILGSVELKANVKGERALEKFPAVTGVAASSIAGYAGGPGDSTKIHVKRSILEGKKTDACRWFLHEASHKFSSTVDKAYISRMDRQTSELAVCSFKELVNNADSYGCLVSMLVQ